MLSYISICVKSIAIFYVEFIKKESFLSFYSSIFYSKKIHMHPGCKMNVDEQGGAGQKFQVLSEHSF